MDLLPENERNIYLQNRFIQVSDCVAILSAEQNAHYRLLLPHGSWVKSPVGCPGWFDDESIGCTHPNGSIIAGSSNERFGNKITLVDIQSKKIKKLPNLDHVIKDFGMTYDDRTAVLTLVGGYTNSLGRTEANKVIFQLSLISRTPNWSQMSTELPYNVNNPMLVNDDEYLYVLGGKDCVTCVRMSKKNPVSWEKLDDLPKEGVPLAGLPQDEVPLAGLPQDEVPLAKEYSGCLYSGAVLYKNKVRVLTRTKYLTLDSDPGDITQKRWSTQSYADLAEKQPISQLTPMVFNDKIVASVKRDQVITVECLNDYKRTWEKIALPEHGRIGAGSITSYIYIN